ncbi:ECF-type sigma factor [Variovorax sp. YR752]|uniref:ECF-type sigma factor n=1 Tax=Variovorax sp. YR752 TaxID=1884383 RepID=UPI00313829D7
MNEQANPIDELYETAYAELRRLAHARLRAGGRDVLIDTTALVHESYLKLSRAEHLRFPDRISFFVYAGRAMRSIVVDMLRHRLSDRGGGGAAHVTLTGDVLDQAGIPAEASHILRVHDALADMGKVDQRMTRVVEMRYFAGMTELEIADALGVSERTVRNDWEQARLFLLEALR